MKRTLAISAVFLLLAGCAGKLGTMAYIPHGAAATLTVGQLAPAMSVPAPAASAAPAAASAVRTVQRGI